MVKKIIPLILLLTIVSSLSACGTKSVSKPMNDDTEAPTTVASAEKKDISWYEPMLAEYDDLANAFAKTNETIKSAAVTDMDKNGIPELAVSYTFWEPFEIFTYAGGKISSIASNDLYPGGSGSFFGCFYVDGTNYFVTKNRGDTIGTMEWSQTDIYKVSGGISLVKTITNADDIGIKADYSTSGESQYLSLVKEIEMAMDKKITGVVGNGKQRLYTDVCVSSDVDNYVKAQMDTYAGISVDTDAPKTVASTEKKDISWYEPMLAEYDTVANMFAETNETIKSAAVTDMDKNGIPEIAVAYTCWEPYEVFTFAGGKISRITIDDMYPGGSGPSRSFIYVDGSNHIVSNNYANRDSTDWYESNIYMVNGGISLVKSITNADDIGMTAGQSAVDKQITQVVGTGKHKLYTDVCMSSDVNNYVKAQMDSYAGM